MKTTRTSKTKVVENILGDRLRMTPTRLLQIDLSGGAVDLWYAKAEDIREAYRTGETGILIHRAASFRTGRMSRTLQVSFYSPKTPYAYGRIGCCLFEPAVFRQILRWFGCRKSRALAAKAGA